MPILESPDIISVKELAARLALHPDRVRRLIRDGELPGVKLGGQYRIPRAWFEAFMRGDKVLPTEPPERNAFLVRVDPDDLA